MRTSLKTRFQEGWSTQNIWLTYYYLGHFFIRGLIKRIFVGSAKGLFLVGRNVALRYPQYLKTGIDTIIEDGAEINCLSKAGITLGNRVTIGKYAIIRPSNMYGGDIGEGLIMGDHANIGPFCYIGCSGKISIGNNVMMGPRVSIFAENHVFDDPHIIMQEQGVRKAPVVIEDDCCIAANSVILAGVTIGKGSVVAAGAVVTKDVPPYSIVAGVPAKIIKTRL